MNRRSAGHSLTGARNSFATSRAWLDRAKQTAPGGVHSNVRLGEEPHPLFFASGNAGHVLDADGNDLIDLACGNGPLILGHSPNVLIESVKRQLDTGLLYAGQTFLEVEASELLTRLIPCAERVRFNLSGTEAVQSALRIARSVTSRQKVLKFQGHYHGWADSVLWNVATPSRRNPDNPDLVVPIPESLGIAETIKTDLLVAEWNDAESVARIVATYGDQLAAVVMEPVMGNGVVIPPKPGYLESIREVTVRHGIVLIFDEVITGFRVALGGAQVRYNVTPDMAVFGKAIAAGFPVACVVGRASLFDKVETGAVNHAGTFNANPVSMAATVATLTTLADPALRIYERLESMGARLRDGMKEIAQKQGAPILLQGLPMQFNLAFTTLNEIVNHSDLRHSDERARRRFLGGLVASGLRLNNRGTAYLSAAHTDPDIERALNIFDEALTDYLHAYSGT